MFFWTRSLWIFDTVGYITGKCFPLSICGQKTCSMKSGEKKSGIHSCRALSAHPALMFPPAAMVWGTDIRVQFQVFFVFFPQVLHGVRQCSLTAERPYAITTMFFANSGNATEYTEAHQHKRHLLSTRKSPAFRKLNKWNLSLSLNLRQIEKDQVAGLGASI